MASILIVSKHGSGIPLALHLAKQEGHLVKIWIKDKEFRDVLQGSTNPKLINSYNVNPQSIDIAIGDMVGIGDELDELKAKGIITACGGVFNDKMELDRVYSMKVAQSIYNKDYIPETIPCKSKIDIIDCLSKDKPMVIKPLGNKAVGLTLVSNDEQNRSLKSFVDNNSDEILPCIVQEKVNGIEITIEGWFNKDWIKDSFNCTIESKRFLNNDKGPNVGCMGNVVWQCKENKLVKEFLHPATDLLNKVDYCGPFAVTLIIAKDSMNVLEFTTRFGYDAIQAYVELLKQSFFDFIYNLAINSGRPVSLYNDSLSLAVRLSMPPYPNKGNTSFISNLQVLDIPEKANHHVWLTDVNFKNSKCVIAGTDGVIGCITARGDSVRMAQKRVYRTINNIAINTDIQYRTDIGNGIEEKILQLTEWGYL